MYCSRRGLLPLRVVTIYDEGGAGCRSTTPAFESPVLNVLNQYSVDELECERQRDQVESLGDLPTSRKP